MMTEPTCKLYLWAILLIIPLNTVAQEQRCSREHLIDHKPLMNEIWEEFDLLMYKVEKKGGNTTYTPYFPPALQELHGKFVRIQGYMVPLKSGLRHNRFLLSVLPIHQCMFCGENGISAMVEINLHGNNKVRISDKPI